MSTTLSISMWLLEATLRGSIAIALIWLLRPFLRRWIGAQATHLLWIVVLVLLLAPWLPSSPLSLSPRWMGDRTSAPAFIENVQISVRVGEGTTHTAPAQPLAASPASQSPTYLLGLWAFGATAISALSLLRAIRAAGLVARAPEIGDTALLRVALDELPNVPRRLRICQTDELRSPALCGILRPTILLPTGWAEQFTPEELRCVLLHEIGHLRRGDLAWHWAFLLVRTVHWFNPLVWLAERSARADQEMACDEWVLAHSEDLDGQAYGEVLLKATRMLGTPRLASPLHATMAESKVGLTRRIHHLAQIRSRGWYAVATALLLAGTLLVIVAPSRSGAQAVPSSPVVSSTSQVKPVETAAEGQVEPASDLASRPQVEIEARFVELSGNDERQDELTEARKKVFSAEEYLELINALNKRKGADIASAPRVTTRSGQRAVIEIIRELRYPIKFEQATDGSGFSIPKEFETRNSGVTLEVEPEVLPGGRVELVLVPSVVEVEGFINYRADQPARPAKLDALSALMKPTSATHLLTQPIFNTRKLMTRIVLESGETALVGGVNRTDEQRIDDHGVKSTLSSVNALFDGSPAVPTATSKITRSLYIFVTARIIEVRGKNPSGVPPQKPRAEPTVPASAVLLGE